MYEQSMKETESTESDGGIFGYHSSGLRQSIIAGHSRNSLDEYNAEESISSALKSMMKFRVEHNPVEFENSLPKGSNPGNLISLLAVQAAFLEEWRDVKILIRSFVQQLRDHVESDTLIPNVPSGQPEWSSVLVEQKLTLLNCCIRQSILNKGSGDSDNIELDNSESGWDTFDSIDIDINTSDEMHAYAKDDRENDVDNNDGDGWESLDIEEEAKTSELHFYSGESDDGSDDSENEQESDEDDDEFFDVMDTLLKSEIDAGKTIPDTFIKSTGRRIVIPETQPHVPMTEDMFQQQQEVFTSLGTSEESSKIRAKLQSASLMSDMCSFKAANEGAEFEDFIRWYSPNDLIISDDQKTATVSGRMKTGLWRNVWNQATPIPTHEQKPLFDHVRESQLALHYLETLGNEAWMRQLLHTVFVVSYYTLKHASTVLDLATLPSIARGLDALKNNMLRTLSRETVLPEEYNDLCKEIEKLEIMISFGISLLQRFDPDEDKGQKQKQQHQQASERDVMVSLMEHLWNGETVELDRSSGTGNVIQKYMKDNGTERILDPDLREYIFQCRIPSDNSDSNSDRVLAHRMYTELSHDFFRVSLALNEHFFSVCR